MARRKSKGDIYYYLPKRKRPIAYSAKCTNDLISILSEIFYSIKDVKNAIFYDSKAIDILQLYIDKGYGDEEASKFFTYYESSYRLNWGTKIYAILMWNFPFANSPKELTKYIEYKIINGSRRWIIKEPLKELLS